MEGMRHYFVPCLLLFINYLIRLSLQFLSDKMTIIFNLLCQFHNFLLWFCTCSSFKTKYKADRDSSNILPYPTNAYRRSPTSSLGLQPNFNYYVERKLMFGRARLVGPMLKLCYCHFPMAPVPRREKGGGQR